MNWLAHLHLSAPDPCTRIGNILPDILSFKEMSLVPDDFRRGMNQHQRVDAFTDQHPEFRRSIGRLPARWRRFGGIIIDVFYDHILAREWTRYSDDELQGFISGFYASLDDHLGRLPVRAASRLGQIRDADLLSSYATLDGITDAFDRISRRLRKSVPLAEVVGILQDAYPDFRSDFDRFFPELELRFRDEA